MLPGSECLSASELMTKHDDLLHACCAFCVLFWRLRMTVCPPPANQWHKITDEDHAVKAVPLIQAQS